MMSFGFITPISPCKASPPCTKIAEVPVEFNVAEVFFPINPLLPIPQTTTLPFELKIEFMTSQNSFPIDFSNEVNDATSSLIVFRAILIILEFSLNLNFFD